MESNLKKGAKEKIEPKCTAENIVKRPVAETEQPDLSDRKSLKNFYLFSASYLTSKSRSLI